MTTSVDKIFSHSKNIYAFIKVKDINKILNTNSECWEIIKEISITSKIKIETNIDCYKYTKRNLIKKLSKIPEYVEINLINIYFCIYYINSEFWKEILRFNNAIINLGFESFLKIKSKSGTFNQSDKRNSSFSYWIKDKEIQVDFLKFRKLLAAYILKPTIYL